MQIHDIVCSLQESYKMQVSSSQESNYTMWVQYLMLWEGEFVWPQYASDSKLPLTAQLRACHFWLDLSVLNGSQRCICTLSTFVGNGTLKTQRPKIFHSPIAWLEQNHSCFCSTTMLLLFSKFKDLSIHRQRENLLTNTDHTYMYPHRSTLTCTC